MLVLKDVLRGEEFQPEKYLTDTDSYYPSLEYNLLVDIS